MLETREDVSDSHGVGEGEDNDGEDSSKSLRENGRPTSSGIECHEAARVSKLRRGQG